MFHETSGRQDFEKLAKNDVKRLSIQVLLPNGSETTVCVSRWDKLENLNEQAISKLESAEEEVTIDVASKRAASQSSSSTVEGVEERINKRPSGFVPSLSTPDSKRSVFCETEPASEC